MDSQEAIQFWKECKANGTKFAEAKAMTLAALREQAEREKGCEYCNGESLKNLEVTHIFGMPKLALNGGNTLVDDADKPTFCPKCGRRLK